MRIPLSGLVVAISAVFFAGALCAQDSASRYRQQLQPLIERALREQEIPGFAIGVVENQRLVYSAAFGLKSLARKDDPITAETLFHMCSITKPFVATSIMQLWERGKVDLEAPVVKYLPHFKMADPRYATITVRQMLSHISGMPDVEDYEWDKPQFDDGALERYVRSLTNLNLLFPPGAQYRYSNIAFEILGDLVAKVSGDTFEGYVQKHILDVAGMRKSTLLFREADPKLMAAGHVLEKYEPVVSKVYPYNRAHTPSSDLHSNVVDMSRWAMINLNRGELDGKRILKSSTYDVMWKPAGENYSNVGISWHLGTFHDHATVSHGGSDTGFRTDLMMIPDRKAAVVCMSNSGWFTPNKISRAALEVALGLKPEPVDVRRPVASELRSTIRQRGAEAAVQQYYEIKKRKPGAYDFGEEQLIRLGQDLVEQNRVKEAIAIGKLNTEVYPSSAPVHAALAKAYLAASDTAHAIESYEKALKLDPANKEVAEALNKLKKN